MVNEHELSILLVALVLPSLAECVKASYKKQVVLSQETVSNEHNKDVLSQLYEVPGIETFQRKPGVNF